MKKFCKFLLIGLILTVGCSTESDDNSPTETSNHAPVIRSISANPASVGRQQTSEITCVATDADGDSLSYYWRSTAGTISDDDDEKINWHAPNSDGQFWVGVTVSDGQEVDIDSLQLNVTVPNEPPAQPWDPEPPDNEYNIGRPVTLRWKCSDIDNDPILYDLYFGTEPYSISVLVRDLSEKHYVLSNLTSGVNYYWRVDARDDQGNTTIGTQWHFRTQ